MKAEKEQEKKAKKMKRLRGEKSDTSSEKERIPTLRELNLVIDRHLKQGKRETDIRDPMINVVNHNQEVNDYHDRYKISHCNDVAIVLGKPLHRDEITVEYANRIRTLVSAMLHENYQPDAVCFVGPQSAGNLVADADAGYLFFRHLTRAYNIDITNIHIVLEHRSAETGAFQHLVERLQTDCLASWRKQVTKLGTKNQAFNFLLHGGETNLSDVRRVFASRIVLKPKCSTIYFQITSPLRCAVKPLLTS